jgi:hypothetical protein
VREPTGIGGVAALSVTSDLAIRDSSRNAEPVAGSATPGGFALG